MAPPFPIRPLRGLVAASLWWLAGAGVVAAAGVTVAGAGLLLLAASGGELGEVQRELWIGLAGTLAAQALAPLGALTVTAWWAMCQLRPGLDRSWGSLAAGIPLLAALAFPPVGALCFTAWTPGSAWDYLGTLLLLSGGVSGALLIPRRLLERLGPGALFPD